MSGSLLFLVLVTVFSCSYHFVTMDIPIAVKNGLVAESRERCGQTAPGVRGATWSQQRVSKEKQRGLAVYRPMLELKL